jgi:DNA-directed RNA polymerase specialized sigma24 family protein
MTDNPEDLKARARRALERSIVCNAGEFIGPVHPYQIAKLERAMLALPLTTREIFLAHWLDDLRYNEIAEITGLSPRKVERHMARAILHLWRFLDGAERRPWQHWWHAHIRRWRR